ncbi:MAG: PEP-CTERM sorting domain-containing protein [Planctomycetota bacterium]
MRKSFVTATTVLAATTAASSFASPIVIDGDAYRTRADNGTYFNGPTSPTAFAYGWANATAEWRGVFAFDLDAENDGVNDLSGQDTVTLDANFADVPGSGGDDFELVYLGTQGPSTSSSYGLGTNYPFNFLFFKNPVDTDPGTVGDQVFQQTLASGATDLTFNVDFLADLSVTAADNVVFFQVRSLAGDFASSEGGARFTPSDNVSPTLTGVPEPASVALAGAGGLMLLVRRRK